MVKEYHAKRVKFGTMTVLPDSETIVFERIKIKINYNEAFIERNCWVERTRRRTTCSFFADNCRNNRVLIMLMFETRTFVAVIWVQLLNLFWSTCWFVSLITVNKS